MCPVNPVEDLFLNNGMTCRSFTDDYSGLTQGFEKNGSPQRHLLNSPTSFVPFQVRLGFLFAFRTSLAPKGWEESYTLRERRENWDMKKLVESTVYVDDKITLKDGRTFQVVDAGISERDILTLTKLKVR
eukprot:Gregarina_sp_Poly_1__5667@NODE_2990_length_1474_cov_5_464819_g1891_i0_p2_GENE_NODE_2990_length_1474_cov_5_464819_g1891_i0NODE_2990_length_1474_cov_5_464819_g1891_i0_p2_ORF_typecomplete_len130_score22_72_NODE_2990_length_1474_cov_5_464819_g1891_i08461235